MFRMWENWAFKNKLSSKENQPRRSYRGARKGNNIIGIPAELEVCLHLKWIWNFNTAVLTSAFEKIICY